MFDQQQGSTVGGYGNLPRAVQKLAEAAGLLTELISLACRQDLKSTSNHIFINLYM